MIAELQITRTIGSRHTPRVRAPLSEMLPASAVLAELERLGGRGVLLLTVASPGGLCDESFAIYEALRAFSRSGGRVVVYVSGYCASTAVLIALAGDVIVMDPEAVFIIHGMRGYAPERTAAANRRARRIYEERVVAAPEMIDWWETLEGDGPTDCCKAIPIDAFHHMWVDEIGDGARAREVAMSIASGGPYETCRQTMLRERAAAAAVEG